jgi:hypothetical protein
MVKEREAAGLALPAALVHVASGGYLFEDELQTKSIEQYRITRADVEKTLAEVVARKPGALYYIAGSPYFTVTLENLFEKLGIPKESMKRDDFDGYEGDA